MWLVGLKTDRWESNQFSSVYFRGHPSPAFSCWNNLLSDFSLFLSQYSPFHTQAKYSKILRLILLFPCWKLSDIFSMGKNRWTVGNHNLRKAPSELGPTCIFHLHVTLSHIHGLTHSKWGFLSVLWPHQAQTFTMALTSTCHHQCLRPAKLSGLSSKVTSAEKGPHHWFWGSPCQYHCNPSSVLLTFISVISIWDHFGHLLIY